MLPEGLRVRDASPSDLDAAQDIVRAEECPLRGANVDPIDIDDFWRNASFDGASWVVERDGMPVAFAAAIERNGESDYWATVRPEVAGLGISSWLLSRAEERAREVGSVVVRAGCVAENRAAVPLLEGLGYREARHFFQMRIDFERAPAGPSPPAGIELGPFRRDDARAFHATLDEAFAEEWGWHASTFEEWRRRRLDAPGTDLSLWFVARDGDKLAGAVRCETRRDGGGWIGALGVLEPWRRRGVGRALLLHALVEFHRRGARHVALGVDTENSTGATRLYEGAGMRVVREDVLYEKELR
ncbi:MAG TPA: GNAT family N-acetyltransferase [Gaiellaceae bacterium]|nr:GNAT family N-acetyltransferase [Gaiellaceae bacterium]